MIFTNFTLQLQLKGREIKFQVNFMLILGLNTLVSPARGGVLMVCDIPNLSFPFHDLGHILLNRRWVPPQQVDHLCFMLIPFSSRRASAQAVTSKRYIRTTSPVNTYSSGVKTDSRRKTGRSSETKRATGDRWVPKRPKFRCRRRRRFGFFR